MQQYFILRDDKEYGPYTLDYLKRYVEKGNIRPEDWARVDGVEGKFYVSELLSGRAVNGAPLDPIVAPTAMTALREAPQPPNVHWGVWLCIILANNMLFHMLSLKSHKSDPILVMLSVVLPLILVGWQTLWAQKFEQKRTALIYLSVASVLIVSTQVLSLQSDPGMKILAGVAALAYIVFWVLTAFSLRASVERCYRECEGMDRSLSGVMTFFFSTFYIQYHFNEISQRMAARRKAGGDLFTGV